MRAARVTASVLAIITSAAIVAAKPAARPDARTRAAYEMLLALRRMAGQLVGLSPDLADRGCPKDIANVTFSMAKTDPWGTGFVLRCTPGDGASPQIGSAGPDRKLGTADDLWSDHAPVAAMESCHAACVKVRACKSVEMTVSARDLRIGDGFACTTLCDSSGDDVAFTAASCGSLRACDDAVLCLSALSALSRGVAPVSAPCADLPRAAAKAGGRADRAAALVKLCEDASLRPEELACIAASKSPHEASLCVLTIDRDRLEALLGP